MSDVGRIPAQERLHTHRAVVTAGSGSSTAKAPRQPNKLAGEGGWTFRAPRTGDLVACPYCDADGSSCDFCDEGSIPADEVLVEMDLHRLDCAVDALRAADLTTHREALSRILSNLTDLMETPNGHAH